MNNNNQHSIITMPTKFAVLHPDDVYNKPAGNWQTVPAGKYLSKKLFRESDYQYLYLIVEDKEGDEWYLPVETVANPYSDGAMTRLETSLQS